MSVKRSRKSPARGAGRKPLKRAPSGRPASRKSAPRKRSGGRGGSARRRRSGALRFIGRTIYWTSIMAIWAMLIVGSITAYYVSTLPDPLLSGLEKRPPNVTIVADDGTVLAEHGLRRDHIRVGQLPSYMTNAVLAIEDRRFYSHFGVDPLGLIRAAWRNYHAGGVVEGGSTITQQLAKNLFLSSERTLSRKFEEMILAVWLETKFSKAQILELYLNRVYFGAGTFGVEAAAKRYFAKSARHVSLAEAALLAGLLKAPSRYAPTEHPKRAEERASIVLTAMVDAEFIGGAQAMAALAEPARVQDPSGINGYEYAVDWAAEQLPDLIGEPSSNLIVETTIDATLQRRAQRAVGLAVSSNGGFINADQGAAVVMDTNGAIRALVGGRSYKASQFNRAVKSLRQPGSAFKPVVYLAALEAGLTPATVIQDAPVSINGWRPKNYSGDYAGPVTMRDALARSLNTVAVRLTMEVGRWRVIRTARRLGISSPLHDNPSIALGTGEVTLLELTGAYVPFANGGSGIFPHIIKRVRTTSGKVIYEPNPGGAGRVMALPFAGAMNAMMSDTISRGTGKNAALDGRPAAGKTGTSQDFRDAWFVGYTAQYVGGVWVGNDDSTPMKRVTGGGLPAQIWREIMTAAHEGVRPAPLPGTTYTPVMTENASPPQAAASAASPGGDQPVMPPSHIEEPFLRRVFGAIRPNG